MKKKILVAAIWIALWQLIAAAVDNSIVLVGPFETIVTLIRMTATAEFWVSILQSFLRIGGGFAGGTAAGLLLASAAYAYVPVKEFIDPAVRVLKSIPIVSFVILILIWAGNNLLAFWISMLVVLPVLYFNTLAGLASVDPKMLEMAHVFHIRGLRKFRYIYLPDLKHSLTGALEIALGMCWKSGVAAEVIGQPLLSIGNGMYRAKINLDTGRLFAWTAAIVLLSWGFEKIFLHFFKKAVRS